jgi:hypothetical protein
LLVKEQRSTRIEFYKVLEHPECSEGIDSDGGGVFHGHIAADLVPHALMLDNVSLPSPCYKGREEDQIPIPFALEETW